MLKCAKCGKGRASFGDYHAIKWNPSQYCQCSTEDYLPTNPLQFIIENVNRDRIYIEPHWETKPALNRPKIFRTENEAEAYRIELPERWRTLVVSTNQFSFS